jgi:hypothetical protein
MDSDSKLTLWPKITLRIKQKKLNKKRSTDIQSTESHKMMKTSLLQLLQELPQLLQDQLLLQDQDLEDQTQ